MDKRPKILIVDDKPENLVALEKVLADLDVEVIQATSGNEALKTTLYHDFALALLDIQMPEMDGYELAEILRDEEKTSRLPFIFISAVYTDNLNIFKGYEQGAFSFITKPFQPEILINKVKFFISIYEQDLELHRLNRDLLQKNEELQLINNELESFSYSISHDLRAPLRAMSGYSGMLEEDYGNVLDEEGRNMLRMINKNALRMGNLVDDLLAFSRLGRKEILKVRINTDEMVASILNDLAHTASHPAKIKVGSLAPMFGDNNLLQQVWINLISNAIKYSAKKENPEVEIGCSESGEEIIYHVKDNGVGFDLKYKDKLFGVFQRLHSASEFEGTGIGLAIVKKIITKHQGRVWADAIMNEGATFFFSLPK
jgi:two-component system sensor histidine kinase/response regulator